ncbi:type VI secretion protein IcmF/TssM N-terminal domain-containing protein [Nitratireductor sp. GCM10026969]|uniref:type VI secretion protein IcmF/TssM N-terminal domain-containing protein n=1 Tax=Nitratireductor sp. GCM10026969 TaxID=3252645 RepID=UPI0036197F65
MRAWVLGFWATGIVLAAGASWLVWHRSGIEDPNLHFAAMIAPVVLWAVLPVLFGRFFWRQSRANDVPGLREQRRAALAFLANRGLTGRKGRYSLPLYLVAGPPGVGKSSLLERSDAELGMPMTIGNGTWWVGSDAIFVEAATGAGARDVFELIRSVRPKLPLNGILLVISPADMTLADQEEHRTIAHAIANELREAETVTGVVAPVYMLLSKVDLVPGFREFFDRQEPQERSEPWGFDLPLGDPAAPQTPDERNREIARGFQRIVSVMRVRHVEWLSREADPVRCGRIHGFSAQVAALQNAIQPILGALSPDRTQAWNGALLRGIFLTSARQEPLSIDALLPDLSQRFAMPRTGTLPPDLGLDEEEHGYFIGGMLQKAILPEAGLASRERRRDRGLWLQWAAVGAIVLATLGAGYFVFRTFDEETRFAARLADSNTDVAALPNPSTIENIPAVLAHLRRLDAIVAQIDAEPAPPDYAFGLSGRGEYSAALETARHNLRRNALLPHLSALIETQLVDPDEDLATLRRLVAVAESADDPESEALQYWLEESAAVVAEKDRHLLLSEGLSALREAGGLTIDPAYVDAARRRIAYRESLS